MVYTFLPVLLLPVLGAIGHNTTSDADFGVIGNFCWVTRRVICRRWLSRGWWWRYSLPVAYNVGQKQKATAEVQENSGAKE